MNKIDDEIIIPCHNRSRHSRVVYASCTIQLHGTKYYSYYFNHIINTKYDKTLKELAVTNLRLLAFLLAQAPKTANGAVVGGLECPTRSLEWLQQKFIINSVLKMVPRRFSTAVLFYSCTVRSIDFGLNILVFSFLTILNDLLGEIA